MKVNQMPLDGKKPVQRHLQFSDLAICDQVYSQIAPDGAACDFSKLYSNKKYRSYRPYSQMNQQEFHQRYEEESEQIYNTLIKLDEDQLLDIINDPDGSSYKIWVGNDNYQIWQVFIARGTNKSIQPLFDIVRNLSKPYLVRYHACTALFAIAGIHDDEFKGMVQYGRNADRELIDQQAAINRLEGILKGSG